MESINEKKTMKQRLSTVYNILKDAFLIIGVLGIGYGLYIGYELVHKNREQLQTVEKSITVLGTGISIDNQRKAKIQKATEMIMSRNKNLKYEVAMTYGEYFVDEADKYPNVDFVLLVSLASQESAFNDKALSPTGAKGLMQLMPTTAMDMCEYLRMTYDENMMYDAKYNIRLGARYVHQMMTYFNNEQYAIAAYNGGPGGGSKYKLFKNGLATADGISKETLDYVPAVLGYKKQFSKLL
jgi:hypothetical protein